MSDFISDEMDRLGADGVDFIPVFYDRTMAPIICSYTKEEMKSQRSYPKSDRRYWKIVNGNKEYVD